jgi:hypothetical protein
MISDELRTGLQNIIQGIGGENPNDRCASIRSLLIQSFGASRTSQKNFESKAVLKEEQDQFLRTFTRKNGLWLSDLPNAATYLTRGGESKVYLESNGLNVIKVNNGLYYATWLEYFTSLVIHNLLFPSTAYTLLGFVEDPSVSAGENSLSVVIKQPFIEGNQANLNHIAELLNFNGFFVSKRQDYFNPEFSIALEDMHDENVIESQGMLFFIDTVFYLMDEK